MTSRKSDRYLNRRPQLAAWLFPRSTMRHWTRRWPRLMRRSDVHVANFGNPCQTQHPERFKSAEASDPTELSCGNHSPFGYRQVKRKQRASSTGVSNLDPTQMRPDDQGELGGHYFVGLCIRAGIDCNKAAWDKTGWDFRVELRFDEQRPTRGLDKDLKPSTFLVQVKTVVPGKRSVRLNLPAADKLAKDPQNSLIVVFLIDRASIVGMTIIPVIDTALSEILRVLRKCDVEAPREYGRRNVSLSLAGTGVDVAPTPEALRSALVGFGEEDAFAHAARKQVQVQSLGYGARPIVGTFKPREATPTWCHSFSARRLSM